MTDVREEDVQCCDKAHIDFKWILNVMLPDLLNIVVKYIPAESPVDVRQTVFPKNIDTTSIPNEIVHDEAMYWNYRDVSWIYSWLDSISMNAAVNCDIEVLEWICSYKWDQDTDHHWSKLVCEYAARAAQMDVLEWVYSRGGTWDEWACVAAAAYGHLDTLKWLCARHDCLTEQVCNSAALRGYLDVLKWADSKGHRMSKTIGLDVLLNGHNEVYDWGRSRNMFCEVKYKVASNAMPQFHRPVPMHRVHVVQFITTGCEENDTLKETITTELSRS